MICAVLLPRSIVLWSVCVPLWMLISPALAVPTPQQQEQVQSIRKSLRSAERLYEQRKFRRAARLIRQIQQQVEKLDESSDRDVQVLLKPVCELLAQVHALLELEGFKLPPIKSSGTPSKTTQPTLPEKTAEASEGSFVRHVAPILLAKCGRCHVDDERGEFNAGTYSRLMQGPADSGPVIEAGDPDSSRMIELIEDGEMPRGGLRVENDELAKLKDWIARGAKFDGADPQTPLRELRSATMASSEELTGERAKLALQHWNLGLPDVMSATVKTENFLLFGSVGQADLEELGQAAESVSSKLGSIFQAAQDEPLIKGRVTIFAFERRYDYSEFVKMVEQRALPRRAPGHWRVKSLDAYATVMMPPPTSDASLEVLLGRQLAGIYVASSGAVPDWFSEGSARVAVSLLNGGTQHASGWNSQLSGVVAGLRSPDDLLKGKLPLEEVGVASYGFVKYLRKQSTKKYHRLIAAVRDGRPFEPFFVSIYGAPPAQRVTAWVRQYR